MGGPLRVVPESFLILFLGLTALGSGCTSPSLRTPAAAFAPAAAPAPTRAEQDPEFAAGASILDGFDLSPSTDAWQIGDKVLLGIRSRKGDKHTVRFLLVELTNQFDPENQTSFVARPQGRKPFKLSSPTARTRLTLYDDHANQIDDATGRFASKLLGFGLYDGARWPSLHPELKGENNDMLKGIDDVQFDRTMRGWLTMFSFSGSLGRKGLFRDMLYDLVAKPNIIQFLLNPTVSLGFGDDWPEPDQSWSPAGSPVPGGGMSLRTIRVPLTCKISGKTSAIADVLVCEPVAPLSLCGGALAIHARNADDPGTTMEVRLLAAKRGAGGQEFQPVSIE